jgi:hypothetical protein
MKQIHVPCNADLQNVVLNMSSGIGRYTCKRDSINRHGPHTECKEGAWSCVMSHIGQVGTACGIGILLNKKCSFALLLQGGMVCSKWECKQPE